MKSISMFLSGDPPTATAQEKGSRMVNGKRVWYKPAGVRKAEAWYAERLTPHIPAEPLTGPLCLDVMWKFPPPGRVRVSGEGWAYRLSAPDLDNAVKILQDQMQRLGFFANDACIAVLYLRKIWTGAEPGVSVTLLELNDPGGRPGKA